MALRTKEKILVTRTDKLGDVILTLPLISEIKRLFPEADIYFLVKEYVKDLISEYEIVDKIITVESIGGFISKLKFLKGEKFDKVINVYPRFELAFLFFLAGIKYRIGTGYRWYSFLYNRKLFEHRKFAIKHESEYNIDLLNTISDKVKYNRDFHFKYSIEEKQKLINKLKSFKFDFSIRYITVHPGSKGSAKDWSVENFKSYVIGILNEFIDIKIVLTGTAAEKENIQDIVRHIPDEQKNRVYDFCGELNLRELMIIIDNSTVFISNSTGPIHIAGALNKKIIGFYPNQVPMNETRWKPLSDKAIILKPVTPGGNMDEIKVENVISETKKNL